jgi:hypothetical protein
MSTTVVIVPLQNTTFDGRYGIAILHTVETLLVYLAVVRLYHALNYNKKIKSVTNRSGKAVKFRHTLYC